MTRGVTSVGRGDQARTGPGMTRLGGLLVGWKPV